MEHWCLYCCINIGWPSEKEDRAPVSLTVVFKREFLHVSFVYMENLVNLLFITTLQAAGALLGWPDLKEGRAPAALSVVMKREFHRGCMNRVMIWKGGQGSCIFNSCIEKGISAGLICIYGEPGETSSLSQHLKLQESCPLLNLVTLAELLQL